MAKMMRQSTLQTLGLGSVLDIFEKGRLPVDSKGLIDQLFGNSGQRGALVVSGAGGIVGAGKSMQLGARLQPYGVPLVALDLPGAADGIGNQFQGLVRAFGPAGASRVLENVIRLSYDGSRLPPLLKSLRPRFLLEAIPEYLDLKKKHYSIFREVFPEIEIRSVTSGFPSEQLGVPIAHPAFPHEINKVWEVVEEKPSAVTHLFWILGLIPVPVSDHWSFVLDVLFCGLTLAGLRYHRRSNVPFWKIDKYIRRLLGPNPFRAHDVIGAKGANFLTWSCLHHLDRHYGELFRPTADLVERKDSGQNWYPPNHFRPLVNWRLDAAGDEEFRTWILGPLFQMTALMLHEKRAHLSHINAIGELCAMFARGILAVIRELGTQNVVDTVEAYHRLHPAAASCWYPDVFSDMGGFEWQQLYVNAEHNGEIGVITIGRESYNRDVDRELNRAIDWLKGEGVDRVIVSGDFHLSTQLVGADTDDFFPALSDSELGREISLNWSKTARRLNDEFAVSVALVNGKRCLGGMLELLMHCHFLLAVDEAVLGMPEVTLPVVPGMEGCHWPFRRVSNGDWPKLSSMLLEGKFLKAADTVGWLVDYCGPLDVCLKEAWKLASGVESSLKRRPLNAGKLAGKPAVAGSLSEAEDAGTEAAREAISRCITDACQATLNDALTIQSSHSGVFMAGPHCSKGRIGNEYSRKMKV